MFFIKPGYVFVLPRARVCYHCLLRASPPITSCLTPPASRVQCRQYKNLIAPFDPEGAVRLTRTRTVASFVGALFALRVAALTTKTEPKNSVPVGRMIIPPKCGQCRQVAEFQGRS